MRIHNLATGIFLFLSGHILFAQSADTVSKQQSRKPREEFRLNLLVYTRIIQNVNGTYRVDENVVPNFRLNKLLRLELGIRHGETSGRFDSYNHYKIELQTKSFFNTVRIIARMSDRIVKYTTPVYSNTNYLMIAEGRYPISKSFRIMGAGGYVWTYQKNNQLETLPVAQGVQDHYFTFKLALRYLLHDKGFIEVVYGAYDVFNPYPLSAPFSQLACDYDLSHRCTLYSYFRYQYDKHLDHPLNDFLGLGVNIHLVRVE